ncbi:MAG TPA: hypothetical protein VJ717_10385, partial [Gemmatimonadaceae bacterium]|nr:hypothetical protein [Gemmatimonadaceae bacterium]
MIWLILIALALGAALAVVLWRLRRVRHHTKLHGPVAILGPLVAPASRPIPRPTMARGMPAVRSQFATPPNDFDQVVVSQPHAPPQRSYAPPQRS